MNRKSTQMISDKLSSVAFFLLVMIVLHACSSPVKKDLSQEAIIPNPVDIVPTYSSFTINKQTKVQVSQSSTAITELVNNLRNSTGYGLPITVSDETSGQNVIQIKVDPTVTAPSDESYMIDIDEDRVQIIASTDHGIHHAVRTFVQLMPASISAGASAKGPIVIASGRIIDYPRYEYRGAMLDVARHFFPVQTVKKYIDYIATYKINHLHLHLTDDQGWRIEIKSRPKLTTIGGQTQVGGGRGGYYTQAQYRDIVAYAAQKHITVIPEIDMPGHTHAALVSYPELNCNPKDPHPKAYTGMKVGFSTFCTSDPAVYDFLDDVIEELAAMTPGPYIHIGGDESHETTKEEYAHFFSKVYPILAKYGKNTMGWADISATDLPSNTIVQHWYDAEKTKLGVKKNAKVVLSPAHKTYLDMQYDSTSTYGLHWAGYVEVDSAYLWDPATLISGLAEDAILGIESPLWSETIQTLDEIEYLAFPRIIGHAEIGWSQQEDRDWDQYRNRLAAHLQRLTALGIQPYLSPKVAWKNTDKSSSDNR